MRSPIGMCRLCGKRTNLTREHLPPKGGNRGTTHVRVLTGAAVLEGGKPQPFQNGFWSYALCEGCNKLTGRLYGGEFAKWTAWGLSLHDAMAAGHGRVAAFRGFPARIAKQVMSTMIAASQEGFADANPHLRDFVLNPDVRLPESQFRLAFYMVGSRTGRSTGVAVAMRPGSEPHVLVEISLPPFGYVLTLSGQPLDPRPASIAWFGICGYDEEHVVAIPELPILPTHEAIPGDYRTRDEIRFDVVVNILTEENHPQPAAEAKRIFETGTAREFFASRGQSWNWGFNRGLTEN